MGMSSSIMVNGLYVNVDPTGEIARKAYWEELARQINESVNKVLSYYAAADEENRSYQNPYNHLLDKYNSNVYRLFGSPYFRFDMSENERNMAYNQERAILEGRGFYNMSDLYVWASSGGVPDRQKQFDDAVDAALAKRREEMLKEVGGESTAEDYQRKVKEEFEARFMNISQCEEMGTISLRA